MATAGDEIRAALRLIGQLAEGETASSETMTDALEAFNTMLDSWSVYGLIVFSTQDQVFTWPAGQRTRTLGPTGDFVGISPVKILDSTYFVDTAQGLSFPVDFISEEQYNEIPIKATSSTYPDLIFANMTEPDATLTVYPVPSMNLEWHFISSVEMTEAATISDVLVIPRGYRRAFKYNLALEIAAEFGVEAPPTVKMIAESSLRALKNANSKSEDMIMALPDALDDLGYSLGTYLEG